VDFKMTPENLRVNYQKKLVFHQYFICDKYANIHTCFDITGQITRGRYKEGYGTEFEVRVKSFLVTNSCNMSCYIKTSV